MPTASGNLAAVANTLATVCEALSNALSIVVWPHPAHTRYPPSLSLRFPKLTMYATGLFAGDGAVTSNATCIHTVKVLVLPGNVPVVDGLVCYGAYSSAMSDALQCIAGVHLDTHGICGP